MIIYKHVHIHTNEIEFQSLPRSDMLSKRTLSLTLIIICCRKGCLWSCCVYSLWRCVQAIRTHLCKNKESTSLNQWKLVYSHTDTIVRLYRPDGPAIQLDGVEAILHNSDDAFNVTVQPANLHNDDVSFTNIMNELKRLVFWFYPEIQS